MRLRLRAVKAGEQFGRTLEFTNEGPGTLVEFYDADHAESAFGRILFRYFAKTIQDRSSQKPLRAWLQPGQDPPPQSVEVFAQVKNWVESQCPEPEALIA